MVELAQRHLLGEVYTYSIASVELPESEPPHTSSSRASDRIVVPVSVNEFAKDSETPNVYRYWVDFLFTPVSEGASEGQWLIQSVEWVE